MYSVYFMQRGRIAQRRNLNVTTLDDAIVMCRTILRDRMDIENCDGLWLDRALLCTFGRLMIWSAYVAGRVRCLDRKTSAFYCIAATVPPASTSHCFVSERDLAIRTR